MKDLAVRNLLGCAALALLLAGCVGSGTTSTAFLEPSPIPTPIPAPTPTPTPTPTPATPPIPPGPTGLQSAAPFAVYSTYTVPGGSAVTGAGGLQLSYSATDDRYTVTVPGHDAGQLTTSFADGSFDHNAWIKISATGGPVAGADGVQVSLAWPQSSDLKYTSYGNWSDTSNVAGVAQGIFAYGIPTATGDIPLSGSATYDGSVYGLTDAGYGVGGSVSLSFDFGSGTLSGDMKPEAYPWDVVPLGDYVFRDTIYSRGSTSFSGAFQVDGKAVPSSFQGSFTGPKAAELMGSWTAPYSDVNLGSGTMSGVWTAKKP